MVEIKESKIRNPKSTFLVVDAPVEQKFAEKNTPKVWNPKTNDHTDIH